MRLRQLARKLGKQLADIVELLASNGVHVESDDNARVENDHVQLILKHYGIELEPTPDISHEEVTGGVDPQPNEAMEAVELDAAISEPQTEEQQKAELIKAPKIELSGLKVLGKIELQPVKKKEPLAESSEERLERSRPRENRRRDDSRFQRKNPIALQREKEAGESEKKKDEEIKRLKEERALHYQKKVNVARPTKAARKIYEDVEEEMPVLKAKAPPRTLWGKFVRWLNT